MKQDIFESIAQVAYAANTAWGNANNEPVVDYAEKRAGLIAAVKARVYGDPNTPAQQHTEWMQSKIAQGWKLGDKIDPVSKTHPALRPYAELPPETRVKDSLFTAIVSALAPLALKTGPKSRNVVPSLSAGAKNDASVAIGAKGSVNTDLHGLLIQLGFKQDGFGSWVLSSKGRGIWVNQAETASDVVRAICEDSEAIGRRAAINSVKQALDIPFGVIAQEVTGK